MNHLVYSHSTGGRGTRGSLAKRMHVYTSVNPPQSIGHFLPGDNGAVTGYVGFAAVRSGNNYYGWLRVQVQANANGYPDEISLVAKAGEPDIFGAFGLASDDIKAGEIAPVPEPSAAAIGGLGLLALGAAGVHEMRRRRRQEIKN